MKEVTRNAPSEVALSAMPKSNPKPADLPLDVVERILSHLPPRQITVAAGVNKLWAEAARSPALWGPLDKAPPLPFAPPPAPRVAEVLSDWTQRILERELWLGGAVGVGLILTGILVGNIPGIHLRGNLEKACLADYCASLAPGAASPTCVEDAYQHLQNDAPASLAAGVQSCARGINWISATGIAIGIAGLPVGVALTFGLMIVRVKLSAYRAAPKQRENPARPRREAEARQSPAVIQKRLVMRHLHAQEALHAELRNAVAAHDERAVLNALARKPIFDSTANAALLENELEHGNDTIAYGLIHAHHPVTPRCFELAMQKNNSTLFSMLLRAVSQDPSQVLSTWISKEAFGQAVEDRAMRVVPGAIEALGSLAPQYINAHICERGATPFFIAAQTQQSEIFTVMLHNGGDLGACVPERGISVEQMARQSRALEALIENHTPSVSVFVVAENHAAIV